jgi:hypothetical protein
MQNNVNMKRSNPLKTPLNALFGSEEVIGSNPIFSTRKVSGNSEAFLIKYCQLL